MPRGDLDVEHDFAVGVGVFAGLVRRVVHGDGGDIGRRQVELIEVGGDVALGEAAAELDDADGLALAGEARGEVVELGDLRRGEALRGGGPDGDASGDGGSPATRAVGVDDMGTRLHAVIEAEDAFDDVGDVSGHLHRAEAATVVALGRGVVDELDFEGVLEVTDGAGDDDVALGGVSREDLEAVLLGVLGDAGEVGGIGTVFGDELVFGEVGALARELRADGGGLGGFVVTTGPHAEADGDLDHLVGIGWSGFFGAGDDLAVTTGERNKGAILVWHAEWCSLSDAAGADRQLVTRRGVAYWRRASPWQWGHSTFERQLVQVNGGLYKQIARK